MSFSQLYGTVINKPIGVIGKSIDLRSQFYDVSTFTFRDYASTAEVISWLNDPVQVTRDLIRMGHFPIYVTAGGITKIYWFTGALTDNDLHELPSTIGGTSAFGAPETIATKAAFSGTGLPRMVTITADETQNGAKTFNMYDGTTLIFLLYIPT